MVMARLTAAPDAPATVMLMPNVVVMHFQSTKHALSILVAQNSAFAVQPGASTCPLSSVIITVADPFCHLGVRFLHGQVSVQLR